MNEVSVLFFATLRDRAGARQVTMQLPQACTVAELKERLVQRFPQLEPVLPSSLVAVNQEYAQDDQPIPQGGEVAIFPPVSGGSHAPNRADPAVDPEGITEKPTIFAITGEVLEFDQLLARITLPSTGAACLFTGMVRGVTRRGEPHETIRLEYQAYKPMAEAKMRQVADEIRQRWPSVEGIAIVQRIGELDPGTPTVLIACTAAHRDTGVFEAARYGIDRLKEIVPVWKKEIGPQGETWVEGEYIPEPGE
jgi:molybdopterin converting factor subunit 1